MPAGPQQIKIPDHRHGLVVQQILDLGDVALLGQQTATARRRILINPQFGCQPHLILASPPLDTGQFITSDPALCLRYGHLHILCRKRTQQQTGNAAIPLDQTQGILALAHGALPHHLTGNHKVSLQLLQQGSGTAQHEGLAVNAGIQGTTVAVAGMPQHLDKFCPQRNGAERNVIASGILGCHRLTIKDRGTAEKRRGKVDGQHINPLLLNNLHRQN